MAEPGPFDDDDFPAGASKAKPALHVVKQPQAPLTPAQFPVTWVQDAELKLDTRPILKGLIEPGSFVVIYGPSGSGKSFFTADIAQHIATGVPWRGRKTQKTLVVYVAAEAGASILRRFIAWRDERLGEAVERVPLAVLTRGPNLLASMQVEALCEQLTELQAVSGLELGLVVFDTLSRSMHGGDENNAEDMTMVVSAADRIRDQFQAATAYVHHSGKDPSKGARGHSALFAAADLVLGVQDHTATIEKVRDGVSGERFAFRLDVVHLGDDLDGDPVTTCLLEHVDVATPAKRSEPTGKNQRIVLKEIRAMSPDAPQSPGTSEIPRGAHVLQFEELVAKASPRFAGLEPFRAKARIVEALSSLQASGFVGVHGQVLWLL